jgi:hypothetical protein
MASKKQKISVDLDAEIVERTRAAVGAESATDSAVVERALNAYLLNRLLDKTQAKASLSGEDAERVAYAELRAARRERGAA